MCFRADAGRNQPDRSRLYVDVVSRAHAAIGPHDAAVRCEGGVAIVLADDDAAFSELYAGHFARIASIATVITKSRALGVEVAQDSFVQLYAHWKKVRHYDAPEAWVRRVAIRIAVRESRRDSRRTELAMRAWRPEIEGEHYPDVDVMRAVAKLPPAHRAVIALYYFDDLPVGAIATVLGKSESSVKVTLHRARHSLASALGGEADRHE